MIDIMFIGQNVGIFGCNSEQKHQYKHFWTQENALVKNEGKLTVHLKWTVQFGGKRWRQNWTIACLVQSH